ncbi:hypothetical protein SSX86_001766 [Deinandra increscens subsp. villosa]|uniref:RNA helicase n=1 Tax=Deinandra increscens subsp. villosa TaxID=3103831 RepID=A0AAP0DSA0_9ASTR
MAAEGASDSSGPRYAPPDSTLPEPWKGLIDGSSGVMYYWNPETNITQYEKPTAVLPSGPPPVPSAPKPVSTLITGAEQPNGIPGQQAHQMFSAPEQQMAPQQGNNIPQSYQGVNMEQSQRYQFAPHQPMQYMGYQQRPPNMVQPPQHLQQFPYQQDHRAAFPQREDAPLVQNQPSDVPAPTPPTQYGGPQFNMQQPSSFGQLQQSSVDYQQHGPHFQNQMGQQPNVPPIGSKMGFEDNPPGRGGNDHYFNAKNGGPAMVPAPHQPKLAAIPVARSQTEMQSGGLVHHNVSSTLPGGPISHNMFGQATGGPPLMNNVMMRPNPAVMASPDSMALSSVDIYRQKHDVTATGDNVPAPFMSFESTGFPPELLREIYAAGFAFPTPIQAQTWPIALQNRDIVAIAKTGSGKTLGYLIPAFMLLRRCHNNPQNGPTVVVLAPTRELATQIQDEAIKFGRSVRISCTCLYGGAPKGPQLKELEQGADIVVATPGRLNDILEMRKVDFRQVSLLVLDEADRMLDMGFEPQIRKIVNEIPPRRQTLMYTATWPKEVRKIASDLLVNPVQVNIGNADELAANKSITQLLARTLEYYKELDFLCKTMNIKLHLAFILSVVLKGDNNVAPLKYVEVVPQMEKQRRVEQILRSEERGSKIIIFCSTKKLCDQLTRSISRNFGAAAIHGDKSQGERDWVLNQFRSGKSPILVATDVAARGLDVKDVRVVINYDFPNGVEDYVHRIGRTGRAGATGVAYTFFSEQDWKHAPDLIKVLEGANQPVPHEVREIATRGGPGFGKDRGAMSRFDSGGAGGGRWDSGGGRGGMRDGGFRGRGVDSRDGGFGGRGGPGGGDMRDGRFGGGGDPRDGSFSGRGGGGSFGGRGGQRDGGFGGRVGMRDGGGFGGRGGNFGGRGGGRDGNFGGRGGGRDGNFGGRGGGRDGNFGGRGGRGGPRGVGFGGPDGGWDRNDRFKDSRGEGRGRGRGRFDDRRDGDRSRGRSYSRSRSRSNSRSWSRSRSRSRSRSYSRSRSRSRSRTPVRRERRRESKFDQKEADLPGVSAAPLKPEAGIGMKQDGSFSRPDGSIDPGAINETGEP